MLNKFVKHILTLSALVALFLSSPVRTESEPTKVELKPSTEKILTKENKKHLLHLARQTLTQYLKDGTLTQLNPEELSPSLREMRGCFVTLNKNGKLRGCVGYIQPIKPLCDCVQENALNAALRDMRFPAPVSFDELKSITIEISVLTVPKGLEVKNREDLLNRLVPGRDGLILRNGWHQATYLPQVWEHFSDKESFLNSLCEKGDMQEGCWRDPDTEILTYQAEVFHE